MVICQLTMKTYPTINTLPSIKTMKSNFYTRLSAMMTISAILVSTPASAFALIVNVPSPLSGASTHPAISPVRPAADPLSSRGSSNSGGNTTAPSGAGDVNAPGSNAAGNTSVNVPPVSSASHNTVSDSSVDTGDSRCSCVV